ncbi:BZ3500_MvSof-1268-A1-R1_Chr5-2g08085 [Microbotryum saponariae]|uniref:BZ3500_MvSof-1268-A1-R1_Chr5-2g08085 protein n=1 Tax=Microbotryum saponariae TaxID=289078 RepID=A0A2X0KIY0_9BASI|nr:BZ3500_MvSof-1268-A1-R1_Chr5-2g08085 [Microbotryum saponariae]SDA05954.1 BZ3501_MvSof-1269-A2-R1_Chr5-2g07907 [Microbotryum saponariae]
MYGAERQGLSHRENRAALLASSNPSSRSHSPLPTHYPKHLQGPYANASRTADDLESQNEDNLQGLSAKVKLLKDITINIGNEVRDSTKLLSNMNDQYAETGGFLSGTMSKMGRMAKRQGGQWCLWMMFLLLIGTIFFWTWLLRRTSNVTARLPRIVISFVCLVY